MDGLNLVGKVINERYELQEVIGSGGMAVVYKGFDRLMNRFVAFKLLKESLKYDDEIVEKFNTEAKASAGLSHQNIVTCYDVGQYEGLGFIVMEYIDGKTLKEYINENKPVKWQTACEIAIQIADALSVAHEHGIIHRDIKPHNILINNENVAKVADFGIARAVSSDTVVAGGSALGSVHYISPEQARGGYVDASSDIYALGVVLYEMLTGALPIDGDNAVSIALKKLEEDPVNPKVINLDIPQELDAVVMKAVSREQHSRYKTADEFKADLKALLNEDSMHIIPGKIAAEAMENKNRKRASSNSFNPIIASFVLVVLLAIGTFFLVNSGGKEYIVPDLMGLTLEEAIQKVSGTEFTIDEEAISYEVSEEHEEGQIFYQDPGANQSVKKNKKIKLKISAGSTEGDIIVPKVIDADVALAKELLDAKKLNYQVIEEEGTEEQINKVIKQTPQDGTKVSEGYTVILHVCTKVVEEKEVEVPSLNGLTRSQAEKELKEFGLELGNVKKEFSDKEKGTVISQSPKSGDTVQRGTSVEIVLSDGKETQEEPPQQDNPTTNQPQGEMKRKTLTISIPDSAKDPAQIRVLANGKEIHNQSHAKSEGKVDIVVQSQKNAEIEVFIDGELMVHKVIEFN